MARTRNESGTCQHPSSPVPPQDKKQGQQEHSAHQHDHSACQRNLPLSAFSYVADESSGVRRLHLHGSGGTTRPTSAAAPAPAASRAAAHRPAAPKPARRAGAAFERASLAAEAGAAGVVLASGVISQGMRVVFRQRCPALRPLLVAGVAVRDPRAADLSRDRVAALVADCMANAVKVVRMQLLMTRQMKPS